MSSERTFSLTIVHTKYGLCLTTNRYGDWRAVSAWFDGYITSFGPWSLEEVLDYLAVEYSTAHPFTGESVRRLARSRQASLWARQLTEAEYETALGNTPSIVAAKSELIERLDDLYDERQNALVRLLETIEYHMPAIRQSALGQVAVDARSRLLDLQRARLTGTTLNRQALAATDELRSLSGSSGPNTRGG